MSDDGCNSRWDVLGVRRRLITGYTRRNLTYSPLVSQFFTTSTYAGMQRKFWSQTHREPAGGVHPLFPRARHVVGNGPSPASGRKH